MCDLSFEKNSAVRDREWLRLRAIRFEPGIPACNDRFQLSAMSRIRTAFASTRLEIAFLQWIPKEPGGDSGAIPNSKNWLRWTSVVNSHLGSSRRTVVIWSHRHPTVHADYGTWIRESRNVT